MSRFRSSDDKVYAVIYEHLRKAHNEIRAATRYAKAKKRLILELAVKEQGEVLLDLMNRVKPERKRSSSARD